MTHLVYISMRLNSACVLIPVGVGQGFISIHCWCLYDSESDGFSRNTSSSLRNQRTSHAGQYHKDITKPRNTETAKRNTETEHRNTKTKHRNTKTAKHRNGETPKHRKYRNSQTKHPNIIFFLFFFSFLVMKHRNRLL